MNEKPTALERISGHLTVETAMTLAAGAGAVATPLAALLPVLTNSLAGQRQQKRIEATLKTMDCLLRKHEQELQRVSDEQYHLLTEAIASTFQTINPDKLAYLRSAVCNCLSIKDLVPQEAAVLARIIRDISAEEVDFISRNSSYKYVHVTDLTGYPDDVLKIPRSSRDSLIVTGLEALGVLEFAQATTGDGNHLCFSGITSKLLQLLKPEQE